MSAEPQPDRLGALRDDVRSFVDEEILPVEDVALRADHRDVLAGLMSEAKARGLWALGHPEELGGGGLPFLDYVDVCEIVGRSAPAYVALGTHSLQDVLMLKRHGTREQQERWLGPLVDGEVFTGMAMTEPEVAGSDPKTIRTTAHQDGDAWVINGHKWFTSWADRAAFVTVIAKSDPTADLHRQFSAFLVPTDTEGFEVTRLLSVMGEDETIHGELRFDGVRVSDAHLLGERGQGFAIAQHRLGPARIFDAMRWLGQAERAFELATATARRRYAHGTTLAEKGEIRHLIAESASQIYATRLIVLDAARAIDAGDDAHVRVSIAKFVGARMLNDVVDRAIQIHGAAGLSSDLPLERMYREARAARIIDGPDEVHRMVVARALIEDTAANAPW